MHPVFYDAVPCLDQGVEVKRKPVLGQGRFDWGNVISTPSQPEGTPCSALVAEIVSIIDGRTSISGLIAKLQEGRNQTHADTIERTLITTVHILYVDGTISRLTSPQ